MTKKLLLILSLFFSTTLFSQNCNFSYYPAGALNLINFTPNQNFPTFAYSFLWDFGDGSTSTSAFPSHTFNSTGVFTVCCFIYDSTNTMVCSSCDSINPSNPVGGCSFSWVHYTTTTNTDLFNAQVAPGTYAVWDFGDSAVATGSSVSHQYSMSGTYTVCMNEVDTNGNVLCNYCTVVTAINTTGTTCTFTYAIDSVTNTVLFAASVAPGAAVLWDFGDNTTGGGTSVSHTYNGFGPYNVCMSASTDSFFTVCTFCTSVTPGNPVVTCSFISAIDSLNHIAVFTAQPSSSSSSIGWDFGDGGVGAGTTYTHHYQSSGIYTVCMTERDFFGTIICQTCQQVTVGSNTNNNCNFIFIPDSINANLIRFFASQSTPNSGIYWDFGDGSIGQGYNVQHVYAMAGTYTVCMNEWYNGAIICTSCNAVTIGNNQPACQAYFIPVSLGLTGYFIDLSNLNSSTATYSWDFGDGGSSTTRFVTHTYSIPGTYTACLTVANNGCTDQFCAPVTVDTLINVNTQQCQANFAILQIAPFQFDVVNLSSGLNLNFNWDFGDGSSSNLAYPSHYYNTIGSYSLCLTVSNSSGCSSTYCDSISVDSLGNFFRPMSNGFTINVLSPAQIIGVNEISKPKMFAVYPNPANSVISVSLSSEFKDAATYKVYAIDGKEVTSGTLTKKVNALTISGWQQGAYILEVRDAAGFPSYQKIIKE